MTSIIREAHIEAPVADVWDAVRDFGAVDRRLVPGFVVECTFDGDRTRVVTFFNGASAHEMLVGVDDRAQRLAYTVVGGALGATHHNSAVQVFHDGERGSRFVWITDVLPDDLAEPIGGLMDRGLRVIKETLESGNARQI